jgi:hypothetical protein
MKGNEKMAIKIDTKVPIPAMPTRGMKYPFNEMKEKGNSFFVEAQIDIEEDKEGYEKEVKNLKASISGAARRYSARFKTEEAPRFYVASVEFGVRCWLVEEASGEMLEA